MDKYSKDLKIIKISLIIITTVVVLFILRLFSFIFIPLFLALLIAILLLPTMDWFAKKKIPNWLAIIILVFGFGLIIWISILIFQSTTVELYQSKNEIIAAANEKINPVFVKINEKLGVKTEQEEQYLRLDIGKWIEKNSYSILSRLSGFVTGLFMTFFFLSLFLTGANYFETYINKITDDDTDTIQIFRNIINALNKFIKVKFIISLLTGLAFAVTVWAFGVKFAIFWGFMAMLLHFVQLLGSIIITSILILFGFVEIEQTSTLLIFSSLLILYQVLLGSVLEPILMGKSFNINTISILISLSIWGFVFGIVGLVLAIPITVFLKMFLERIPSTKNLARMMSTLD